MPAVTKGKRRLMGDINVVPYIDVMLVLLIIFMITAPLLTQGIKVDLPKANAEAIASQANQPPLVLSIDAQGQLYLNLGANPRQPIDDQTDDQISTANRGVVLGGAQDQTVQRDLADHTQSGRHMAVRQRALNG